MTYTPIHRCHARCCYTCKPFFIVYDDCGLHDDSINPGSICDDYAPPEVKE